MALKVTTFFFFSLVLAEHATSQDPKFIILSQKIFQSGSIYNVSIFTEIGSALTKFKFSIATSVENYTSEVLEVPEGQTRSLSVQIPQNITVNSYYNLSVSAEAPSVSYTYSEWNYIYLDKRSTAKPFLILETDKPIYKPGDTVRFRVILLNGSLLPIGANNDNEDDDTQKIAVDLKMTDSKGNVVKMWDTEFTKGLASSSFAVSSQPNLGQWTLTATTLNDTAEGSATFTVDTYILPAFKVNLKVPSYATFNDEKISAEIQAAYTYGKRVQGNCTIKVFRCWGSGFPWASCGDSASISRDGSLDQNGKVLVDLNLRNIFQYWEKTSPQDLKIEATCWDSVINRPQNASAIMKVYQYPYVIELLKQSSPIKPGFPVTFTFKISTPDGRPIAPKKNDVALVSLDASCIAFSFESKKEIKLLSGGTFGFTLEIPSSNTGVSSPVNVTYNGVSQVFYPTMAVNYNNPQLRLTRTDVDDPETPIEAGKLITLNVAVSKGDRFTRVHYILSAKGHIVSSGSFQAPNATSNYTFQLSPPSLLHENSVNLTVFVALVDAWNYWYMPYVTDSLELHYSSSSSGANSLKIKLSKGNVKPNGTVKISLNTDLDSIVALKGIDQSVLALKSDTDLRSTVDAQLDKYDKQLQSDYGLVPGIESLGVVLFTSCTYFRYNYQYYRRNILSGRSSMVMALGSSSIQGSPVERKHFPETWLWEEIEPNTFDIVRTVPETITSWIITGYSLNSESGIGFASPTSLTVFMPFFVTVNLPYSVVQGEAFYLQVLVHNYLGVASDAGEAIVTLDNSENQFQFLEPKLVNQTKATKRIKVANDQVRLASFLVKTIKFGSIPVRVTASNGQAGDSILQTLQVKPKGILQSRSQSFLIDLRKNNTVSFNASVDFPPTRILGTDTLKIAVTGELLGTTLANLKNLIQMPCGCGEQNMIYLVPDIVVLVYLNSTGGLTLDMKNTLITYVEAGYQNQLSYRLVDGSFAVFQTYAGSTWLTSYVIRSFLAASPFIKVDPNVIQSGLQFLSNRSASDGSFFEGGTTIHTDMMGGVRSNPLALTAYAVLVFLESGVPQNGSFSPILTKSLNYIGQLNNTNSSDVYTINLITYALHLADHPNKGAFLSAMMKKVKKSNSDLMYWDQNQDQIPTSIYPLAPLSIESTAYALLTLLLTDKIEDAICVGKWLTRIRNEQGGFFSTQDTVVGITSLAMLAKRLQFNITTGMSVDFDYDAGSEEFQINKRNARILQERYLKSPNGNKTQIDVLANGRGIALAQVSWSYYMKVNFASPAFSIAVKVASTLNSSDHFNLNVCTSFLKGNSSNMALMEVSLPSGFVFDTAASNLPIAQPKISRVDNTNGNTKLTLYFATLTPNLVCMDIAITRSFDVANSVPAFIQVYDYYNVALRGSEFYDVPQLSVCDICGEDMDCETLTCK